MQGAQELRRAKSRGRRPRQVRDERPGAAPPVRTPSARVHEIQLIKALEAHVLTLVDQLAEAKSRLAAADAQTEKAIAAFAALAERLECWRPRAQSLGGVGWRAKSGSSARRHGATGGYDTTMARSATVASRSAGEEASKCRWNSRLGPKARNSHLARATTASGNAPVSRTETTRRRPAPSRTAASMTALQNVGQADAG